jgi:hypothetical protein
VILQTIDLVDWLDSRPLMQRAIQIYQVSFLKVKNNSVFIYQKEMALKAKLSLVGMIYLNMQVKEHLIQISTGVTSLMIAGPSQ